MSNLEPPRTCWHFLGTQARTLVSFRGGLGPPASRTHANPRGALPSLASHPDPLFDRRPPAEFAEISSQNSVNDSISQSLRIALANQN
eukprot:COSAG02_NODE_436_length_22362_cov_13.985761_2_plen_88_part_00